MIRPATAGGLSDFRRRRRERSSREKFIPGAAVVAALAGSVFFGILWLNNLVSAWRYHVMLAEGDTFSGTFPPGLWPALSWSAVDASTVTTWIPFSDFC